MFDYSAGGQGGGSNNSTSTSHSHSNSIGCVSGSGGSSSGGSGGSYSESGGVYADKGRDNFVCPSDRQLSLRAILHTGWRTNRPNDGLQPEEKEAIISVIKRNEQLEVAESQRVGKLVDKVEKIKQKAAECGPKYCRLCGHAFGLLGLSKQICHDCQQPVCSKCSIELQKRCGTVREMWRCKICLETREMWKKSGAWFYKGLPKYELPQRPVSIKPLQQVLQSRPMRTTKLGMEIDDTSSDENDSVADSLSQTRRDSQAMRQQVTTATMVSEPEPEAESMHQTVRHSSASSLWSIPELLSDDSLRSLPEVGKEPLLGWIELSVVYREATKMLECTVIRARDLPAMDSAGLADPFCKLNMISLQGKVRQNSWLRTKTVHKSCTPEFNEMVAFANIEPAEMDNSILYAIVLDDDKYGHDFLGAAKLSLSQLWRTGSCRISLPLGVEDQYCIEAGTSGPWPRGQIHVALCYNTRRRALVVRILSCANLISMDSNGSSDPFVKLQLKPDANKRKFKTSIKWHNLNPVFNEEFTFATRPNDLDKKMLVLSVWDKDLSKSNDFLGSLVLGSYSKGRRLKQWRDCVQRPDTFHECYHYLSSTHE